MRIVFVFLLSLTLSYAASASQVFPPANMADCGANSVLAWTGDGDVYCRSVGGGSDFPECREGQAITKLNGVIKCVDLNKTPVSGGPTCELISGSATSVGSPGVVMGTGQLPIGDYGPGVVSVVLACSGGRKMSGLDCTSSEGQRENSAGFSSGHCYGSGVAGANAFPINYSYTCCTM